MELIKVMGENEPEKEIIIEDVPTISEIRENGVGSYLNEVMKK